MSTTRGHRRLTTASLLLLLCLFVLHASGILAVPLLHRLDEQIQDTRLRATMPRTLDERIVIVDIDEKSLAEVGRWPWPRDRVADLVDRLFGHDIRLLGMDTVFAEPDPLPGADQRLAQAIRGRPVVLGYYFTSDREGRITGQLPAPVLDLSDGSPSVPLTRWNGYGANLPGLMQAGASAGFFNAVTDDDGVVRSLPLLASHGDQVYESLGLALFRQLLDRPSLELDASGADGGMAGVQGIRLIQRDRQIVIPTDGRGALLVPFRGMGGHRAAHSPTCPPPMCWPTGFRRRPCGGASCCWAPRHRACRTCGPRRCRRSTRGWRCTPTCCPGCWMAACRTGRTMPQDMSC